MLKIMIPFIPFFSITVEFRSLIISIPILSFRSKIIFFFQLSIFYFFLKVNIIFPLISYICEGHLKVSAVSFFFKKKNYAKNLEF